MSEIDLTLCAKYHHAVEIIGRRWNGAILLLMLQGANRFNELKQAIPNISDKMLSERLKELEAERLVTRIVIPETPVRVEYRLTDKGRALEDAIAGISRWAEQWAPQHEPVT